VRGSDVARFELKNRWAVVTGASSGIGKALAQELAERGCCLVLTARREQRLAELAAELNARFGVKTTWRALDLTEPNAAAELAGSLESKPISILVNNAGVALSGPFQEADRLAAMIALNTVFLTDFTRRMLPRLLARSDGARILNVGSIAGCQGVPYMAAYAATKAFVNNFSEGLDWELRGSSVGVACLMPGQTATEFFEAAAMTHANVAKSGLMSAQAVARVGVKALIAGRGGHVAGWFNKFRVFSLRLTPRWLVRLVITWLFRDLDKGQNQAAEKTS